MGALDWLTRFEFEASLSKHIEDEGTKDDESH